MFWLKQKKRKVSKNMPSQSANYFVPSPWSGRRDGKKPLQWAAEENARATRFELSISLGIWFCVCVWRMYFFYSFEDVSFYICFQYLERKWKRCTKAFCNFTMSSDVLSLYSSRTGSISMGVIYVYIYIYNYFCTFIDNNNKGAMELLGLGGLSPFLALGGVVLALVAMIFGKTPETWLWQHAWATFCFYWVPPTARDFNNIARSSPWNTYWRRTV